MRYFVSLFLLFLLIFLPSSVSAQSSTPTFKVLVLKYFPLTSNSQNIDIAYTGDIGDPYSAVRQRTVDSTNRLRAILEKATTYMGFQDQAATPSILYQILDTKEYTQPVPMLVDGTRRPNYNKILSDHQICNLVDTGGVREVWIWAYQGPNYPGSNVPYLNISESKMSGPFGDISNSYRYNDMPLCNNTYRVYTFNYQRGTAEAFHSWGHQIEAQLAAVDQPLFSIFQGPAHPQETSVNGRCGSVHNPPNARFEYDYANPNPQKSDCLLWNPDSMGTLTDLSCITWKGCNENGDQDNPQLNYMLWNWQNLPGKNNTKTYQTKKLRNLWEVHADFDRIMGEDKSFFVGSLPPNNAPAISITDNFDRANSNTTLGQTQTGQIWESLKGVWGISGNQAYSADGCPAPGYALVNGGSYEGTMQLTITINGQDIRLPFRFKDLQNYYFLENKGSFYAILKVENGVLQQLATTTNLAPQSGDQIKIELKGAGIKVSVNNVLKLQLSDFGVFGTKFGIGNWCKGDMRIDNFSFSYQPTSQASPSPVILSGDVDQDGDVDIFDYNSLVTDFGKTGQGLRADFNNNGRIDIFDFNTLVSNFGKRV